MQLRELKYIVFFEYIKDIRRYSYDIEDFLKNENLCDNINPLIHLADEIEPLADRISIIKDFEDKTYIFNISQVSLSIVVRYKNDSFGEDKVKDELILLKEYADKLVNFLINQIPAFKILFEGISIASSKVETDIENIQVENFNDLIDENRIRISKEIDEKYIFMKENVVLKTYKLGNQNLISPFLLKNKKENFLGWEVILFTELNNRLFYNYNEEITSHNRLENSDILKFLELKDI
ncbi:hypothetical protein ACOL3I_08330 [Aliarcobacter butzleri]